jgi:hypothetical protein
MSQLEFHWKPPSESGIVTFKRGEKLPPDSQITNQPTAWQGRNGIWYYNHFWYLRLNQVLKETGLHVRELLAFMDANADSFSRPFPGFRSASEDAFVMSEGSLTLWSTTPATWPKVLWASILKEETRARIHPISEMMALPVIYPKK